MNEIPPKGNDALMLDIVDYWLKRGYDVKVWTELVRDPWMGKSDRESGARHVLKSDLVNGLPKDYRP